MLYCNDLAIAIWEAWARKEKNNMYHYDYVTRMQAKPYREEFQNILFELQDLVRDNFTFQFQFIGSSARNMITFDSTTNIGFDFDVNIEVNDPNEEYSPREIRNIIINALNRIIIPHGFNFVENGTRVLTIKKVDLYRSKIQYSCDIAIVNKKNYNTNKNKKSRSLFAETIKEIYDRL